MVVWDPCHPTVSAQAKAQGQSQDVVIVSRLPFLVYILFDGWGD